MQNQNIDNSKLATIQLSDGKDYLSWKSEMLSWFYENQLMEIIDDLSPEPSVPDYNNATRATINKYYEWKSRNAKAKNMLSKCLHIKYKILIQDIDKASNCWNELENYFMQSSSIMQSQLEDDFDEYKLDYTLSMESNIMNYQKLLSRLKYVDSNPSEKRKCYKLLKILPKSYDPLKTIMKYTTSSNSQLFLNDLIKRIEDISREKGHWDKPILSKERVHYTTITNNNNRYKNKSNSEYNNNSKFNNARFHNSIHNSKSYKPNNNYKNNLNNSRNQSSNQYCTLCGGKHQWYRCPHKNEIMKYGKSLSNKQRSANEETKTESANLCQENVNKTDPSLESFFKFTKNQYMDNNTQIRALIDSGCTTIVSPIKALFSNIVDIPLTKINQLINCKNKPIYCKKGGIINIPIKCNDNSTTVLKFNNAIYEPKATETLISSSLLSEIHGYSITTDNSGITLWKENDSKSYIRGTKENNLYYVNLNINTKSINKLNTITPTTTGYTNLERERIEEKIYWHYLFGHASYSTIDHLSSLGIIPTYLKDIKVSKYCIPCNMGKQCKLPYPKESKNRSKNVNECLLLDLLTINKRSIHNKKYVLGIMDQFSSYDTCYFLKDKSETSQYIKQHILLLEKKVEKPIKILRMDRGGEFINNELLNWLKNKGIEIQLTSPGCSPQNGQRERSWRTLMNITRSLLYQSSLSSKFWTYAFEHAVNIRNRIINKSNKNKSPIELVTNKSPDLTVLNVFGSRCTALRTNVKKLEARAYECIYIGINKESKAYNLWNISQQKIIISRDIIFDKNIYTMMNHSKNQSSLSYPNIDFIDKEKIDLDDSDSETDSETEEYNKNITNNYNIEEFKDNLNNTNTINNNNNPILYQRKNIEVLNNDSANSSLKLLNQTQSTEPNQMRSNLNDEIPIEDIHNSPKNNIKRSTRIKKYRNFNYPYINHSITTDSNINHYKNLNQADPDPTIINNENDTYLSNRNNQDSMNISTNLFKSTNKNYLPKNYSKINKKKYSISNQYINKSYISKNKPRINKYNDPTSNKTTDKSINNNHQSNNKSKVNKNEYTKSNKSINQNYKINTYFKYNEYDQLTTNLNEISSKSNTVNEKYEPKYKVNKNPISNLNKNLPETIINEFKPFNNPDTITNNHLTSNPTIKCVNKFNTVHDSTGNINLNESNKRLPYLNKNEDSTIKRSNITKPTSNLKVLKESISKTNTNYEDIYIKNKEINLNQSTSNINNLPIEPKSYWHAMKQKDHEKWKESINAEFQSLVENNTWSIIKIEDIKNYYMEIDCMWIFKLKTDINGNIERYKARLVARGDSQIYGVNYTDTSSPVLSNTSLIILLCIATANNYIIENIDINTAFLYGNLKEDLYMKIPPGIYENLSKKEYIIKLNESIYGLKQSSLNWYNTLKDYLLSLNFIQVTHEKCIFILKNLNNIIILGIYVDDILILSNNISMVNTFKSNIKLKFKIKELGSTNSILGIKINKDKIGNISLSQYTYIKDILQKFNYDQVNPSKTPMETKLCLSNDTTEVYNKKLYQQMIGSLLYLMIRTRPDISYSITTLSQFNNYPSKLHHAYVKRIFRYIKYSEDYSLIINNKNDMILSAYCDASFAPIKHERKSISGFVCYLGNTPVIWKTKKQSLIAKSTMECELYALEFCLSEVLYLRNLLQDLGYKQSITKIYHDNQASIYFSTNQYLNSRNKHIDLKHCFIKQHIELKNIEVVYISTYEMKADGFTKSLGPIKFNLFKDYLNLY